MNEVDASFVNDIAQLTRDGLTVEIDGVVYSALSVKPIYHDPRPATLVVRTLTGLLEYLCDNMDGYELEKCAIHVKGHDSVDLITDIRGESNERNTPVTAKLDEVERFQFGRWIGHEEFCIQLRSRFERTDDLDTVLAIVGKIDVEESVRLEDDGVSQRVTVKKGVAGGRREEIQPPATVLLRPFRTFNEIEQPQSEFLFRVRRDEEGVKCALFEADGGRWRTAARQAIKGWFDRESPEKSKASGLTAFPIIIA